MKKFLALAALAVAIPASAGTLTLHGFQYSNPHVARVSLYGVTQNLHVSPIFASFDNSEQFLAYCIEILTSASAFGVGTEFNEHQLTDVNLSKLFTVGNSLVSNRDTAAAFQLAVWEVYYDGFNNADNFKVLGAAPEVSVWKDTLLQQALTAEPSYSFLKYEDESIRFKPNYQNFITPVPEPGTLGLLALGLVCIALRKGLK